MTLWYGNYFAAVPELQTSGLHTDDTRALMTAVLLGGIDQDDLMVWYWNQC